MENGYNSLCDLQAALSLYNRFLLSRYMALNKAPPFRQYSDPVAELYDHRNKYNDRHRENFSNKIANVAFGKFCTKYDFLKYFNYIFIQTKKGK